MIAHPIDREALVLQKLGGEATGFAARQHTPIIATNADPVLTMTRALVMFWNLRHVSSTEPCILRETPRLVSEF